LPPPGQVASTPDLVNHDEYRRGSFYQSPASAVLLTVLSGARMIDDERRRRIAQIVPHLRRALQINKTIDLQQSEAATFADTLNGLSAGLFLVDAGCRIVHANTAGDEILRADDFLRSVNGQLVARDVKFNQTLREVFADSVDALGVKGRALPLTAHDGERYLMHVLPVDLGGAEPHRNDLQSRRRPVRPEGRAGQPLRRTRRGDV
jgi:hypothetical protein